MCSHACGTEFLCRLPFSLFVTEAGLTARDVSQAYVCPGMPLPTPQGHTRRTLCPSLPPLQGRTCRHCLMTTVVVTVSPSRCMCAVRLLCVCLLRTTLVRTRPWCRTPAPTARHGPQGMHPPPVPSHLPRRPPTYDRPRLPSSRLSPPDFRLSTETRLELHSSTVHRRCDGRHTRGRRGPRHTRPCCTCRVGTLRRRACPRLRSR